jgi:hypothetical protein
LKIIEPEGGRAVFADGDQAESQPLQNTLHDALSDVPQDELA